jgi:formate dehydrogenase subunit gamma
MLSALRSVVASFVVASFVALSLAGAPALAQQPSSVNPTASSVKEQQLLEALKADRPGAGTTVQGRITIPDPNARHLIQPQGQAWRDMHQGLMPWIGAVAILGMLAALAIFYLVRGRIRLERGYSGVRILRFSAFDRAVHWLVAGCFVILALSGLNVTLGKVLLLPLLGEEAFATFSQWAKYAHNYLAWPFMLGLAAMFVIWVAHNIPGRVDWEWIRRGGGIIGNDHPPAEKFNAGQKGIFWAVIIGGTALSVSGVYLLFPAWAGGVLASQFWNIVHGIAGMLLIAVILGHIYIGTIGMEGAIEAMTTGEVDLNWAKEHHSLWVEQEQAKARVHPGAAQPAE